MEVYGGRVIIRSKPFVASELGEGSCSDSPCTPAEGLKFSTAIGRRSNEVRGFDLPNPPSNSSIRRAIRQGSSRRDGGSYLGDF